MQHIAYAKLAKARKRAEAIRPYGRNIRGMVTRIIGSHCAYTPALMVKRTPVRRIGVLVVTTDKGLCGPLNTRLLQHCLHQIQSWQQQGIEVSATVVGLRGLALLRRAGVRIVAHVPCGPEFEPTEALLGTISVPILQFMQGDIDALHVATNRFVNVLSYEPLVSRFLPLDGELVGVPEHLQPLKDGSREGRPMLDYAFEPELERVVDALLRRFVETIIYQAIAENAACEQSARMTAMKAATENADRRIEELTVQYHQGRQEAITRELIEIVAGAAAIEGR